MSGLRLYLTLILKIGVISALLGQQILLDSLHNELLLSGMDTSKVKLMIDMSYYYRQINPDSALSLARKAEKLSQELDYQPGVAWAKNRTANAYWMKGKYPDALRYSQEALAIFKQQEDVDGMTDTYNILANTHNMEGDHVLAIDYYEKCKEVYRKSNNQTLINRANANIGRTYYMLENFDRALNYLDSVILDFEDKKKDWMYAVVLNTKGDVLQKLNKHREALTFYFEALEISEDYGNKRIITYSTRGISEVYQVLGQPEKSNQFALRTLNLSKDIDYLENLKNAALILSENYERLDEVDDAFVYFKQYTAAKDSMYSIEKERELKALKESFEVAQRQQEIELLKVEQESKEQILQKQRFILFALVIIVILVVVQVFVLRKSNLQKQRANELLTQQRNRLSVQNIEIKKQQVEIIEKSEKLEQVNQTKNKLFSIISHDLRSPFNAILGLTTFLKEDYMTADRESLGEVITGLDISAKNAYELQENLLTWASAQMKGIQFSPQPISLFEVVEKSSASLKDQANNKQIRLVNEVSDELMVNADKSMIATVLRNLINNAIKFTGRNGEVKISSEDREEQTVVSVSDSGVGIEPDRLNTLFELKDKGSTRGTEDESGTGLGLNLCKEFVNRHGGEIWVESMIGQGSVFYFTIPKSI